MTKEFQIDRDKSPTQVSQDGVNHSGPLLGLKHVYGAYSQPFVIALQGLFLSIFLQKTLNHQWNILSAIILFLMIFGSYAFDASGWNSPEDKINQPLRVRSMEYWGVWHWLVVGSVLLIGGILFLSPWNGSHWWPPLLGAGGLYICYSVFRWKWGLAKPIFVATAWTLFLISFFPTLIYKQGLLLQIFGLLLLDSLWLDLFDQEGDRAHGIDVFKGMNGKNWILGSLLLAHLLFLSLIFVFPVKDSYPLLFAHLLLATLGAALVHSKNRTFFALSISSWSLLLMLFSF